MGGVWCGIMEARGGANYVQILINVVWSIREFPKTINTEGNFIQGGCGHTMV